MGISVIVNEMAGTVDEVSGISSEILSIVDWLDVHAHSQISVMIEIKQDLFNSTLHLLELF